MIERILLGLDGSALAETILPFIVKLAGAFGAEVRLVHVVHVAAQLPRGAGLPTREELTREAESRGQRYLEKVSARLAASGITATTALLGGDAATEIVDYARRERADLIALTSHGHSGLTRLLRGSVAEKVLHMTATPLLLMRPGGASAAARTPTHILVPLDGSVLAESALATAEMLARRLEVPIVLVRVVEVPVILVGDPMGELFYDYGRLLDEVSDTAKAYVSRIAQALRDKGLQVSVESPVGAAALEIERHTERSPGAVIVLATHGHGGIVGGLLGSVARQVLRADVPTVVVPPPARERRHTRARKRQAQTPEG